jgi:hypothetical protein
VLHMFHCIVGGSLQTVVLVIASHTASWLYTVAHLSYIFSVRWL